MGTGIFDNRRNYLRARGEYPLIDTSGDAPKELPPRTRRILTHFLIEAQAHGTTSAHAENTKMFFPSQ